MLTPPVVLDIEVRRVFALDLLRWYRASRRDLPWRARQDDPYAVWVAEAMLQQTQVATVVPYYHRWMARFPDIRALADAAIDDVLLHWAGLGYYARARNLHRGAKLVVAEHGGALPADATALEALPGIGRYTAGAVASIAYDLPVPLVDSNVARVLSRVFALEADPRAATGQAALWAIAGSLVPERGARDHNQALMELGACLCTPIDPGCDRCPLLVACRAGASDDPTAWPRTAPRRRAVRVTHAAIALRRDGRVLVARRPPHGLWGGLWEYPRGVCAPGESPADCAVRAAREAVGVEAAMRAPLGIVRHSVTHHAITLHAFEGDVVAGEPRPIGCAEVRWVWPADLDALPRAAPQSRLPAPVAHLP